VSAVKRSTQGGVVGYHCRLSK